MLEQAEKIFKDYFLTHQHEVSKLFCVDPKNINGLIKNRYDVYDLEESDNSSKISNYVIENKFDIHPGDILFLVEDCGMYDDEIFNKPLLGNEESIPESYRNEDRWIWFAKDVILAPYDGHDDYGTVYPWMTANLVKSSLYWQHTLSGHGLYVMFDQSNFTFLSMQRYNDYYCKTLINEQGEKWVLINSTGDFDEDQLIFDVFDEHFNIGVSPNFTIAHA